MKITPEVLTALGFSKKANVFSIMSRGYKICIEPIKGSKCWRLYYNDNKKLNHWIDHVEEVFGCIADDFYSAGRKVAKKEIKDFLFNTEE